MVRRLNDQIGAVLVDGGLPCIILIVIHVVDIFADPIDITLGVWCGWIIAPLILFGDCIFAKRSIGKRICGIAVYDKSWKQPSIRVLFVRSILIAPALLGLVMKRNLDDEALTLYMWEWKKFGTRVIKVSVYNELSEKAKKMDGDFAENMEALYSEYERKYPMGRIGE